MSNIQQNINQMISSAAIATNLAKGVEEQKRAVDESAKANAIKEGEMKAESDALKAEIGKEQVAKELEYINFALNENHKNPLIAKQIQQKVRDRNALMQAMEGAKENNISKEQFGEWLKGYKKLDNDISGIRQDIYKRMEERITNYKNSDYYKEIESLRNSEGNISRYQLRQARAKRDIENSEIHKKSLDDLVKKLNGGKK